MTRPDLTSLINVQGDRNCLFCVFSLAVTGSESQHMRIRSAILEYMLSIEHLLIGRDTEGHANYLYTLNYSSVQDYINATGMAMNGNWGTEFKMMVFSHMNNINVFSFDAGSNTWCVFSPVNIDKNLHRDYTTMSLYIYFRHSHFYVVTSIRSA